NATFVARQKPQSFDALVSKASNVERQIAQQSSLPQKSRMTEEKKFDNNEKTRKMRPCLNLSMSIRKKKMEKERKSLKMGKKLPEIPL
ncbi:unnamed protein product, partial [Ilex paraguariensis]